MYAGVESVETSLGNDQVIVKGVIDPAKLVDYVYKRTKKQASIVKEEEKEKKEEEEKKDGLKCRVNFRVQSGKQITL